MIPEIKDKQLQLQRLCEKYYVSELYLFGSAAKGSFDPKSSDIDMAVHFLDSLSPVDYAENFFSLIEDLENLFNRKVELLSLKALKNEVMIDEIESSKVKLYGSSESVA
jgi:predicted nucleotidyltransferase